MSEGFKIAFATTAILTFVYFALFLYRVHLIKKQTPAVVSWRVYLLNLGMLAFAFCSCLLAFLIWLWP